jgi:predicted PurR-regulated permease PerM
VAVAGTTVTGPETPDGDTVVAAGRSDPLRVGARAAVGVIGVAVLALALWKLRSLVTLLLLAITFAAAIRPGVDLLRRRRVPESLAIFVFFAFGVGAFVVFFWFAVPPALHQLREALQSPHFAGHGSTGFEHDVLAWINRNLRHLPSGSAVLHPIAAYGRKGAEAVVGVLFTLAATWYFVSERDQVINAFVMLSPEHKRERARETYLAIDERLGRYTRLRFLMIFAIGAVLAAGFYLVGLHYWLLLGGFVSLLEMIPVVGPLLGGILVAAVGLTQSLHIALLALAVLVVIRQIQDYVINPHVMGGSVGLSPLVTLITVTAVGILFGPLAVVLAIPATSAAATLIDVFVLEHEPPAKAERRSMRLRRRVRGTTAPQTEEKPLP